MVTRLCQCQNFVSIKLLIINGVSGVGRDFMCSMLHLQAAIKTIAGKASSISIFCKIQNRLMAPSHGRERYLEQHGLA